MPGPQISEDQKKLMIEAIGQGLGKGSQEFFDEMALKDKIKQAKIDGRYELTLERLIRIETKLDALTQACAGVWNKKELRDIATKIEARKS